MNVAVIGSLAASLINFRGELLATMVARGHRVLALAPDDDAGTADALRSIGVEFVHYPLERTGTNPIRDLRTVLALRRALRAARTDVVLAYTAKAVIYGMIAARLARVPARAAMITGAGSALQSTRGIARLVAISMRLLYRVALRQAGLVFFQNPDDEALFRRLSLVQAGQRTQQISGSGVNLTRFAPADLPRPPATFLLVARLLRDKGIFEFVEAARLVRNTHPDARFQLLGPLDTNPSAVRREDLEAWQREGVVEYLGFTSDVRPYLARAHVLVLPSYGEGTPRSVLEAMSTGRPVVTTDVPGCRETVIDGQNGLLVPPRDPSALAMAMRTFLVHPERIQEMGEAGRALAVEKFDVHRVNRCILEALHLNSTRRHGPT